MASKNIDLSNVKLLGPYGINVFKLAASANASGDQNAINRAVKSGVKEGLKSGLKVGGKRGIRKAKTADLAGARLLGPYGMNVFNVIQSLRAQYGDQVPVAEVVKIGLKRGGKPGIKLVR